MKENYWIQGGKIDTDRDFIRQQDKEQQQVVVVDDSQQPQKQPPQQQQQQQQQKQQKQQQQQRRRHSPPATRDHHHHQAPPLAAAKRFKEQEDHNNIIERPEQQQQHQHQEELVGRGHHADAGGCSGEEEEEDYGGHQLQADCERQESPVGDYRERLEVRRQTAIKREENEVNLSFCGCGFLGIYHVGVASCFHQYAPQLSMHKISGSSAGALVAVAHICGNLQLAYATTDILRVAIDARARALGPFHPSFDIQATVREALERGLPDDVHEKASGKLHISLTRAYDGENVVVSEFDSKEEVIQALLCSCFIPFWSGFKAPKFRGTTYIDGGFSLNLLLLDDKTVSVSPFAGEADICPQDDSLNLLQISLSNTSFSLSPNNLYRLSHALLPPPPEVLSDLCEQGFADGIRFLQRMKLISCTKCLEIRSSLLVTTNGEDMEEAFAQEVEQSGEDELMELKTASAAASHHLENHHIRLEQQEQKMIEITGSGRRNSVVSTTSHAPNSNSNSNSSDQQEQYSSQSSGLSGSGGSGRNNNNNNGNNNNGSERCNECARMRQRASSQLTLPAQFSDRIRDACDAVNKSLSNWIYSYRPIKYLSYLAAPYYLPLDISLALVLRCWQQLPVIRSELFSCFCTIAEFVISILQQMRTRSTARLLMSGPHDSPDQLNLLAGDSKLMASTPTGPEEDSCWLDEECCRQAAASSNYQEDSISIASGVSSSHHSHQHPHQGGHHQARHGARHQDSDTDSISVRITSDGVCVSKLRNSRSSSHTQLHSLEDTFDSIVDVTDNQEARIFAYYFRDAKNRLQVTEIFDLELQQQQQQQQQQQHSANNHHHQHHQSQPPFMTSNNNNSTSTTSLPVNNNNNNKPASK